MEENQDNIFTAKSVDEAIIEGLQALNLTLDEAEIEVIDEGKKKLFSATKAKVRITKKSENATKEETKKPAAAKAKAPKAAKASAIEATSGESATAVAFVNKLLEILKIEGSAALVADEGENIKIDITTPTTARVIGKRGDVLDSIQAMAGAVANIGREDYKKVVVDCEGYRTQREESLKQLALKLEKMAVDTGKKVILEPMNPYERRIIHAALVESTQVKTASEGREPIRYVVVIPNGADPKDRGIRYGGNNRSRQGGGRGGFQRGGQRSGGRSFHSRDGEKREGGREGRPYGDRPYNRDRGERGDKPYGDRPYNKDRGERSDRPYGDRPYNKDRGERGDRPYNRDRNSSSRPRSGAPRAKKEIIFGTYLGNSQKDKAEDTNKSEE